MFLRPWLWGEDRIEKYQLDALKRELYAPSKLAVEQIYKPFTYTNTRTVRKGRAHQILEGAFKKGRLTFPKKDDFTGKVPELIRRGGFNDDPYVKSVVGNIEAEARVGYQSVEKINEILGGILKDSNLEPAYKAAESSGVQLGNDVWDMLHESGEYSEKFNELFKQLELLQNTQVEYNKLVSELVQEEKLAMKQMVMNYIEWANHPNWLVRRWRGRNVTWERLNEIFETLDNKDEKYFIGGDGKYTGTSVLLRPIQRDQEQLERLMRIQNNVDTLTEATKQVLEHHVTQQTIALEQDTENKQETP